jgi:hypothetical protein
MSTVTVLILDLTALGLGALLASLSYLGYKKNGEASYAYACAGFGALGLSAVVGTALGTVFPRTIAEHLSSVAMIIGFGLVIYGGEMAQ